MSLPSEFTVQVSVTTSSIKIPQIKVQQDVLECEKVVVEPSLDQNL